MRESTFAMLEKNAPAALGNRRDDRVSDKYSFIPTSRVVDILEDQGWDLTFARQVKSRTWSDETAKHHLSFRHQGLSRDDLAVGDSVPQIELINAHNGLGTYRLLAGIFRFVCSNGMVVSEQDFASVTLRHIGFTEDQVIEASNSVIEGVSRLSDVVDEWQQLILTPDQKVEFATQAEEIRWGGDNNFKRGTFVENLLNVRREADQRDDLWGVYNVVQENLLSGGFNHPNTNRRARSIKNIDKDISYNQQLWGVAREFAALN